MRKPAVVVALILALTLCLTLARRLAQPAITDQPVAVAGAVETSGGATASPAEAPRIAPAPIRPSIQPSIAQAVPVAATKISSRAQQASSRAQYASSRAKRGILSPPAPTLVAQRQDTRYEAMLASPDQVYSRARDYGAHGIGTPKWIESLSGAKARVPVRDFSGEAARNGQSHIEPLAVSIDSRVDLAH